MGDVSLAVVIPVGIFVLVHAGSLIWFMATIKAEVSHAVTSLNEVKATLSVFVTEKELNNKMDVMGTLIESLDRRVEALEAHEK